MIKIKTAVHTLWFTLWILYSHSPIRIIAKNEASALTKDCEMVNVVAWYKKFEDVRKFWYGKDMSVNHTFVNS